MSKDVTILCIDDDEEIRFALGALFRLQGWETVGAPSVEEGVAAFEAHRPSLVLIDYHMPRVNGVDGVRMLRRLDAAVPIIVFTIEESQAVADAFLEAGASDFALKPIKAPDIISRIKLHLRLLESRPQERAPQERLSKGMSPATLALIEDCLAQRAEALTADEVAHATGLAYQTVFRYLQHLVNEGRVEVRGTYGKVGRPKQTYRKVE